MEKNSCECKGIANIDAEVRACFDASSVRKPSTLISVCQDPLTKRNGKESKEGES